MSDQSTIKITAEDAETLRALGKPHGASRNLTDGVRVVCQQWIDAGKPPLPEDPYTGGGLLPIVSRWGETWATLQEAGGGSAGRGARRLAAWVSGLKKR
jgi:hypothetical protein